MVKLMVVSLESGMLTSPPLMFHPVKRYPLPGVAVSVICVPTGQPMLVVLVEFPELLELLELLDVLLLVAIVT